MKEMLFEESNTWCIAALHDFMANSNHKLQPVISSYLPALKPALPDSPSHVTELQLQHWGCGCDWLTGRSPGGGAIVTQGSQRRVTALSHPQALQQPTLLMPQTLTQTTVCSGLVSQSLRETLDSALYAAMIFIHCLTGKMFSCYNSGEIVQQTRRPLGGLKSYLACRWGETKSHVCVRACVYLSSDNR